MKNTTSTPFSENINWPVSVSAATATQEAGCPMRAQRRPAASRISVTVSFQPLWTKLHC